MNKKKIIFILILVIVIFFIVLSKNLSFHLLNVKECSDEKFFFQQIISPGNKFGLKYIHSVAQTPVWEFFEMTKDGGLILTETHFFDHGAGLPYAAFGNEIFISEDDKFKIKNMSRRISLPLYYRIGKIRENHFIYKNQDINLSKRLGDAVIIITIVQLNLFEYILNKFTKFID